MTNPQIDAAQSVECRRGRQTQRNPFLGLTKISTLLPVLFPVHPRTRQRLMCFEKFASPKIRLLEPQGYLDFLSLTESARVVVTDSGGIQEETCYLGIPCLTIRTNTERPVTVACGTNRLVPPKASAMIEAAQSSLASNGRHHEIPEYWDGQTAKRIVDIFRARCVESQHALS